MKYVFTALILIFILNGCANALNDNPKVETKRTITTLIINKVGHSGTNLTSMSGPGASVLTAVVTLATVANATSNNSKLIPGKTLTDVRINGKRIKYGCNLIKSKGKLVLTYKDDKQIFYVREHNSLMINGFNTKLSITADKEKDESDFVEMCNLINKNKHFFY